MGSLGGGDDGWGISPDLASRFDEDHSLKAGRCTPYTAAMVGSRLKRTGIVPEVCHGFAPLPAGSAMRVAYGGADVVPGMHLPSRATQLGRPHVEVAGLATDERYTLVFVHADERERAAGARAAGGAAGTGSEKLLWVVTDIPGAADGDTREVWESGTEVVPYMGTDAHGDGTHRNVFLLYKQQYKTVSIPRYPVKSRYGFSARRFAVLYSLGTPVAACYFLGGSDAPERGAARASGDAPLGDG